jgi:hypothetical protein
MFINKDSIQINNVSMGQYITNAKYGYHKLWAKDTGRNLAGENTGTLIGIFPKITLNFRKLTQTELETLATIFDSATQSLTYYDPNKQANVTIDTYTNDWEVENDGIITTYRKNKNFSVAFISRKKRQ